MLLTVGVRIPLGIFSQSPEGQPKKSIDLYVECISPNIDMIIIYITTIVLKSLFPLLVQTRLTFFVRAFQNSIDTLYVFTFYLTFKGTVGPSVNVTVAVFWEAGFIPSVARKNSYASVGCRSRNQAN